MDISDLNDKKKTKCKDVDNPQILLTKELLGSKNIDTSLTITASDCRRDTTKIIITNEKQEEKEEQTSNQRNGHTEEKGVTEEVQQQESK